jgi:NAD(P)H dehydrogenase (quinone)
VRSLVVLSHPEPTSLCAALARTAAAALSTDVVDLYAEGFDPVLSAADFRERAVPGRLQPMDEQAHASKTDTYEPGLQRHVDRFRAAELLVLVQPLWWFSLPAMAKGYIDRVFANGVAYDYPATPAWTGPLTGRRALAVFTSSYDAAEFGPDGLVGPVAEVLYPLLHGTLAYTGMTVLDPFIAYGADSVDETTRAGYLAALCERLVSLPPAGR